VGDYLNFVVGWCDHFELNVPVLIVDLMLSGQESFLDDVNTIELRAGQRKVNSDLKRV
jgi:hypothetical protein